MSRAKRPKCPRGRGCLCCCIPASVERQRLIEAAIATAAKSQTDTQEDIERWADMLAADIAATPSDTER